VYAYDVMAPDYVMPLQEKLAITHCVQCGTALCDSAQPFPEYFLSRDGSIKRSKDSGILISPGQDNDSIGKEFWDLYS
jgi:hypothetical protein